MAVYQLFGIILTLAAVGGYLNHRYAGLPTTIGHMAFALALSGIALLAGKTGWFDVEPVRAMVGSIDFSQVVLHGMLSFLLFAGALHIDLRELRDVRLPVGVLATFGVMIAVAVTGTLTWWAAGLLGVKLPFMAALLFGALISPTDPIAVLSILKQAGVPRKLYVKIGGESLFNDGVGVVIFLALLSVVTTPDEAHASRFALMLARESLGGIALGCGLGWVTYRLLRTIDEYKTEVLLTLGLVAGGSLLAEALQVSAPLGMVAAGLIVGNHGRDRGMSDDTRDRLDIFWELIDEVLNAVLFFLVGLEILIVPLNGQAVWLGLACIGTVLAGRAVSVALPVSLMRLQRPFDRGTIRLMVWGGLRGGLSIAMALSLPEGGQKPVVLALTYIVVLFSILVQGLTYRRAIALIRG
jgi:CPA1 family monovalent cation:H+ antiporter